MPFRFCSSRWQPVAAVISQPLAALVLTVASAGAPTGKGWAASSGAGGRSSSSAASLASVPDVVNFLRGVDIAVLPSHSEGMSNALLEFMAAGKPVVVSKTMTERKPEDSSTN